MYATTQMLKALADETRLRLFNLLSAQEMNVGEIVRALGMGQSRISRHLRILSDCGLLECRRDGLWAFYRAARQGRSANFGECLRRFLAEGGALDGQLTQDLDSAARVMAERRQATSRFFDGLAAGGEDINRAVLGDLDLTGAIAGRIPAGSVCVDLGCASGGLLARLAPQAAALIGVDGSARMLEEAGRRLSGNGFPAEVSLRLGDLSHLPLKDGEADAAILSMVLHHLDDPAQAVLEASRALRTGGKLIVADYGRHAEEDMRRGHGDRHLGIAAQDMLDWLDRAGFAPPAITAFPVNRGLRINLYETLKSPRR